MSGIATFPAFATAPTIEAIAWALLHFLWQGALVGLAAAVALRSMRFQPAAARYALALVALLAMLALPVATAVRIAGSTVSIDSIASAADTAGTPAAEPLGAELSKVEALSGLAAVEGMPPGFDLTSWRDALSPGLPWIFGFWLAGVALLALFHLGGWRQVRRLAGSGRPLAPELTARVLDVARRLGVSRAVRPLASSAVTVPAVIGWLKPVILVPASSLAGLSPWQLEAILAHELAHVRRHDALVNLLQAAVETLLFFHPAVWWVSNQVRAEREHCCDDLAVSVCGDRLRYARALADLEGLRAPLPQFALPADGGSLLDRVRRLMGAPTRPAGRSWLAGLLALSIVPLGLTLEWDGGTRLSYGTAGGSGYGTAKARHGDWTATRRGDRVDLETTVRWKSGGESHLWQVRETYETKDLVGLAAGTDVRFELRREAGTFLFAGRFAGAKGSGSFTFQPDAAYLREMTALGYSVDPDRQMELAIHDVSAAFAREIRSLGFTDTTFDQLTQLRIQGVTVDYARDLRGLVLPGLSVDQLIQMKIQGVSPPWVRELNAAGYRDLTADQLVQLKIQGVSAAWVQGLGYDGRLDLSADELVQLKIQGVDGPFVREAVRRYGKLSADELVRLKLNGQLKR